MQLFPNWLFNRMATNNFKQQIEKLSHDIEKRISKKLEPIEKLGVPKEIWPLINSLNRLISYFEERSEHEKDFTSNASHELRTPLAGIRLQTEIALGTDDKKIQQKALEKVLISIDRNERLIEQLLILARLTSDKVKLTMNKINLNQLSSRVVSDLRNSAYKKHIVLNLELEEGFFLFANEESIYILLHNVIRNAINYTPKGGKVWISAKTLKNKIILSIMDNGPGIVKNKRELVLMRFQKDTDNVKSGSGLGLAIVKHICNLHHATLYLDETNKRGGLKVMITFHIN